MRLHHDRSASVLLVVSIAALLGSTVSSLAAERYPEGEWERVDPDSAGWSTLKLQKAEAWSKAIKSTAVMVVHHGVVVDSVNVSVLLYTPVLSGSLARIACLRPIDTWSKPTGAV